MRDGGTAYEIHGLVHLPPTSTTSSLTPSPDEATCSVPSASRLSLRQSTFPQIPQNDLSKISTTPQSHNPQRFPMPKKRRGLESHHLHEVYTGLHNLSQLPWWSRPSTQHYRKGIVSVPQDSNSRIQSLSYFHQSNNWLEYNFSNNQRVYQDILSHFFF